MRPPGEVFRIQRESIHSRGSAQGRVKGLGPRAGLGGTLLCYVMHDFHFVCFFSRRQISWDIEKGLISSFAIVSEFLGGKTLHSVPERGFEGLT